MTEILKQKIKEELVKLPKERQDAINSFDWAKITEEIGKKFSLTDDEINDLQIETGLILIGLADIDLYAQNIEYNVGTSSDEAEKIANESVDKIFTPLTDKINLAEKVNSESESDQTPIPPYANPSKPAPEVEKSKIETTPPPNLPIAPVTPTTPKPTLSQSVQKPTPIELPKVEVPQTQSGIMSNAGIEMINEVPLNTKNDEVKMTIKEDSLLAKSGIDLVQETPALKEEHFLPNEETQKSALYGIEHPEKTESNLIKDKLSGTFSTSATVSDHSLPKNNIQNNINRDPYHEQI